MKNINALLTGIVVLILTAPVVLAEEAGAESEMIELLETVALIAIAVAVVLSILVGFNMGGQMGNALKVIALAMVLYGGIREVFEIVGNSTYSEIFEIVGGLTLLVGFLLMYRATK